jgi:outer membrane protein insertion porin family
VTVEGANAITTDQILNVSKLRVGQVVNEQSIQKARDSILRYYANSGRIKAVVRIQHDVRPAVPGEKLEGVDLRIEIVEGALFVLRRLEFIGNETTRDRIVRRRVLQQEGQPFNQGLMEKSVNRINSLGRFKKLTMADVEMRIDEKEGFVDLLVHLKEIRRIQTRR